MLGAIPVPVYADSVADETRDRARARRARRPSSRRTRSRSTRFSAIRDRLPRASAASSTTSRAASATTTIRGLDVARRGRWPRAAQRSRTRQCRSRPRPAHRRRRRRRSLGHPLHLGHHRPLEGRGAERRALHRRRARHRRLRQPDRPRRGARLSAARLGRRPLSQLRAGLSSRASAWPAPKAPTTAAEDLREIGPTFHFAPPRVFEALLTRVHDPHGGREPRSSAGCSAISWTSRKRWGEKIANGEPVPLRRAAALRARRPPDLRAR